MIWGVIAKKRDGTWKVYTLDTNIAAATRFEDVIFASYNLEHEEAKRIFCQKVRFLMSNRSMSKEVSEDVIKLCGEG